LALVTDIDHLSLAISHATAPAFMLGAVAGFLSILIARLERVADKIRALRSVDAAAADPSGALGASFSRRMVLLSRAIYFAVLSALVTAAFLIGAFVAALEGVGHARLVATMFACLMTFRAEEARRNRWERVAALSTAARDGSGVR